MTDVYGELNAAIYIGAAVHHDVSSPSWSACSPATTGSMRCCPRILDVIWAFPVLAAGHRVGNHARPWRHPIGGLQIAGESLWIPILGSSAFGPGLTCRTWPGRSAARSWHYGRRSSSGRGVPGQGTAAHHDSRNCSPTSSRPSSFFTLNIANNMLLESALSFLGAVGVRPPNASWGTMIAEGYQTIYTAPHLTIVPGLMIVLTVLSLNASATACATP